MGTTRLRSWEGGRSVDERTKGPDDQYEPRKFEKWKGDRRTSEDVSKERRDVVARGEGDVGLSLSNDRDLVIDDGDEELDPIRERSVEDEEGGKADLLELVLERSLEVERRGRGEID